MVQKRRTRCSGRTLPKRVDEVVGGNHAVPPEQERSEQRALFLTTDPDDEAAVLDLERSQQEELHRPRLLRQLRRRQNLLVGC